MGDSFPPHTSTNGCPCEERALPLPLNSLPPFKRSGTVFVLYAYSTVSFIVGPTYTAPSCGLGSSVAVSVLGRRPKYCAKHCVDSFLLFPAISSHEYTPLQLVGRTGGLSEAARAVFNFSLRSLAIISLGILTAHIVC